MRRGSSRVQKRQTCATTSIILFRTSCLYKHCRFLYCRLAVFKPGPAGEGCANRRCQSPSPGEQLACRRPSSNFIDCMIYYTQKLHFAVILCLQFFFCPSFELIDLCDPFASQPINLFVRIPQRPFVCQDAHLSKERWTHPTAAHICIVWGYRSVDG